MCPKCNTVLQQQEGDWSPSTCVQCCKRAARHRAASSGGQYFCGASIFGPMFRVGGMPCRQDCCPCAGCRHWYPQSLAQGVTKCFQKTLSVWHWRARDIVCRVSPNPTPPFILPAGWQLQDVQAQLPRAAEKLFLGPADLHPN